ncbi:MAG: hypothetical protein EAZ07_01165 [Cytophagales bacterium]|nr:MAG: hypothetical protein EAZ07_01165 [Cytophagales bacterium]
MSLGKLDKNFLIENNSIEVQKLISSFTNIVNSQTEITHVCKSIAEGDFSSKAVVRSENDELSLSVNKMIDNLKNTALEDKKRNWTTEGLAIFAEILRSDNQLSNLSDKVISKLVKYLDAN